MSLSEPIIISLISSIVGGVIVAIINQLFTVRKTHAEAEKLRAETEKIRAEAAAGAEKLRAETEKILAEAAKIRSEFEKFNAYLALNTKTEIEIAGKGEKKVLGEDKHYTIHKRAK